MDAANNSIRSAVVDHMDYVSKWTGTDVFLLKPKQADVDTTALNGLVDRSLSNRLRFSIFGDIESCDHAKTRVLIMIDQVVSIV